jgi:hypothetical protein
MDKIAVRAVDLQEVDAEGVGALGSVHVILNRFADTLGVKRDGRIAPRIRNGRCARRRPASLVDRNRLLPFPRDRDRSFATGVPKLKAKLGAAELVAELDGGFERRRIRIGPETAVVRAQTRIRIYGRRLND